MQYKRGYRQRDNHTKKQLVKAYHYNQNLRNISILLFENLLDLRHAPPLGRQSL